MYRRKSLRGSWTSRNSHSKPEALQRGRRPPSPSRDDIERAAHSHRERHAERRAVRGEEVLLAGRAHADEEDVGAGTGDSATTAGSSASL